MSNSVRFGILSFAHYHANFWADAINQSTDATLAGIWDDDPLRGQDAANRFGAPFHSDLATLLRQCDAVGITSATAHHATLVEAAAAAGVHILLEKPMATSLAGCDRIERAVRAAGVLFMQNFPKRFDPVNDELVTLVHQGQLGEIGLVRVRHGHFHGLDPSFASQWFVDPALSGGGTLIDEGIHAADFLRWLLGEPVDVRAAISHRLLQLPVEDTAAATFTFAGGTIAEVATSWSFVAAEHSIEVYGSAGSALLGGVDLASRDFATPPYVRLFRHGGVRGVWDGSPTIPRFITGDVHQQGPRHFIDCVCTGRQPAVGLEDGRRSLAMILAAYRAARTGASQSLPNDRSFT
ncbi:MAG: Gfo/Idh/MocA family protein [Thermomicrobiales bacterium]